ncbi:DUF4158 domain-containing protein (plasmid) [Arsenophonus nasoniae]|uniref:DUF4158 domain-containing protein n=1 Tax=Arsenophonus nasoniae TaxID=638 RepID=A0A4P7LAR0_9GAMM|nr:DUF4158 domain-containing protein [Arsenophonus nasoniae]QBY46222.1 hypothetical protein ArsFIN_48330 [Arsenophonus nasoniae]WGM08139.1 DUF4158 domain-containing protein [Arsenophonus nasoniae]WGM13151.1 DUF4158 domain-containing protein [Arsenophonus nasoniae]WGM17721.1 DUF4158 domain-containing protein [Arsenophonus nasoniae]
MSSCYDQTILDFWTLTAEESTLLSGMTDKDRLGFATQLKFIDIHGRFHEHHNEIIDPQAVQWLATQIKVTPDLLGSYDFPVVRAGVMVNKFCRRSKRHFLVHG